MPPDFTEINGRVEKKGVTRNGPGGQREIPPSPSMGEGWGGGYHRLKAILTLPLAPSRQREGDFI